jgi:hypothetical protein
MNKKILLTLFALFISNSGFAQIELDDYIGKVGDAFNGGNTVVTFQTTEIEGNPLLFDQFLVGVLVNGKSQTVPVRMNLDLANNRILVDQDNKIIAMDNSAVTSIQIKTPKMTFKNGFSTGGKDDLNKNSLFEVIFEGDNYTVLKHTGVSLQEDVASYGTAVQKDVFVRYTDYYLITSENGFEGLSSRKRRFFRVFGDDRKAIEKYVDENDLDFKDDTDRSEIFAYADSL